jgi:hypothetical protein
MIANLWFLSGFALQTGLGKVWKFFFFLFKINFFKFLDSFDVFIKNYFLKKKKYSNIIPNKKYIKKSLLWHF